MNEEQMEMLKMQQQMQQMQIKAMQDQFVRMQNSCEQKCVMTENEIKGLTRVEAVCIDNCVRKYLDFQVEMQIHMRELQEPAQIQALQMQQMELGRQMGL